MAVLLRRVGAVGFAALAAIGSAACGGGLRVDLYEEPTEMEPAFSHDAVAQHLRAVGGDVDRSTGQRGLLQSAAYAAAAWSWAGLQPLAAGDFRIWASGALNRATGMRITRIGPDSLAVDMSPALSPDARSSRGARRTDRVWMPDPGTWWRSDRAVAPVALLTEADTSSRALMAYRQRGVLVALQLVDRVPSAARRPLEGLLLARIDSALVARLLGAVPEPGRVYRADLLTHVDTEFDAAAPVPIVVGLVPGRDPVLRHELVVVGASFDRPAGDSATAVQAAAVIEAGRTLALLADAGEGPERTTMFALWAGSRQGHSGLRSWLGNPGWSREATRLLVAADSSSGRIASSAGWPARSVSVRPRPEPDGITATEAAADLARRLLLDAAPMLWERKPSSRVPPAVPPSTTGLHDTLLAPRHGYDRS